MVIAEANGSHQAPGLQAVLSLCSALYGVANRVLDAAYRCGILRATRLPVPVISIGNVSWGGNGKTPMTIFLARLAHAHGLRPLILTRGYGQDEDKLLCRHLSGIAGVGSGADRAAIAASMLSRAPPCERPALPKNARCMHLVAEGETACRDVGIIDDPRGTRGAGEGRAKPRSRFSYDLVILDDGLQHRKLVRDSNILMINCLDSSLIRWHPVDAAGGPRSDKHDTTPPELHGVLLPRGTLRESLQDGLAKADLVVLHNADLLSAARARALQQAVATAWRRSRPELSALGCATRGEGAAGWSIADDSTGADAGAYPVLMSMSQVSALRRLPPETARAGGGTGGGGGDGRGDGGGTRGGDRGGARGGDVRRAGGEARRGAAADEVEEWWWREGPRRGGLGRAADADGGEEEEEGELAGASQGEGGGGSNFSVRQRGVGDGDGASCGDLGSVVSGLAGKQVVAVAGLGSPSGL
jgi:tetraacyldisaccharide-1-P 4'-kinase